MNKISALEELLTYGTLETAIKFLDKSENLELLIDNGRGFWKKIPSAMLITTHYLFFFASRAAA